MRFKKPLSILLSTLLIGSSAAMTATALEPHGTGIRCRNWLTNDPTYTFSKAYTESIWHENFTALQFSGNQRNDVLAIAISQLGYHEGNEGDFSGTDTASSGNSTEYARLLIPHYNNNAYEWCACFVNWCLNQAHIDSASSEIGCWKWVEELKGMDMFEDSVAYGGTYVPKPADMIFFNWNGVNTHSGHVGYVLYTTTTHVFTIEGNADDNVTVRSYPLDDKRVIGYGTPNYDEGDEPTVDHSYAAGRPSGYYVLNADNVNVRKEPGAGSRVTILPLGALVKVSEVANGYAYITYNDKCGYIPVENLYLMGTESNVTVPVETAPDIPPETFPETNPETLPETIPETVPFTEPETTPETEPQTHPETRPVIIPESKPITTPVPVPQTAPITIPITAPESDPETDIVTATATNEGIAGDTDISTDDSTRPADTVGCASSLTLAIPTLTVTALAGVYLRKKRE